MRDVMYVLYEFRTRVVRHVQQVPEKNENI